MTRHKKRKRNPVARALRTPAFGERAVRNKTKYRRKTKHPRRRLKHAAEEDETSA